MIERPLLAVTLLAVALPAQENEPTPTDPGQAFHQLIREYGQAQRAHVASWREAVKKAEEAGEKTTPAFSFAELAADWVPRFRAEAERFAGTDGALPFLVWVLGNGDRENGAAVVDTILEDHLQSSDLGSFLAVLGGQSPKLGAERVQQILDLVLEKNPHADVRAQAFFSRGEILGGDEGLADIRKAAELAEDPRLAARARGVLFEKERLQIGMEAPDIVGEDLDGVPFKLSDYRGKVVMLDFWGDW